MPKKLTHEEFVKIIQDINPNIEIIGTYTKSRNPILCRCKICKNEQITQANNLRYQGCPYSKKINVESFISEYINE